MNKNFKSKVEERLKSLGKTQRWLAESLGVSEVTVSRWLSGERNPSVEMLEKTAGILETSTSYLLSEDENQNQKESSEKKSGGFGGILSFAFILGITIAAVAAGILSKEEKETLIKELEKNGDKNKLQGDFK